MHLKGFPRSSLTIRQWSALLVTACILPATLATIFLIYTSYKRERASVERGAVEISRALMQAIDRELASAQGALESLGTSPYLTDGDLARFYGQAAEVLHNRPGNNLSLSDASAQQLLNMREQFGAPIPKHGNAQQILRVFKTAQPMVSDVYAGSIVKRLITSVDIPVKREGEVRYVLSMQFYPERLGKLLNDQRIPEGWVVAILDSSGIVVTRTRDPDRFIGKPATPGLMRAMAQAREGSLEDRTLEGIPSVAVFSRSSISNWSVVIGMNRDTLIHPLRTTISWFIVGALLLFALSLFLARIISERIATSIRGLVEPAIALGYGKPVNIPPLHLYEAHEVGQALIQASQLLHQRTAERDQAEQAEHDLREAKRQVEQSEAFLRGTFDETPNAVFLVDPDGRIARENAEAEHLFGYSQAALRTLSIDDLLFDPGAGNQQSMRETLFAISSRCVIGGDTQLQGRRADTTAFPVDLMASPLHVNNRNLIIATVRDVTERERSEAALRESEKRFRSTLEHAPIGIAIVSLDGRWVEVNNAVCEILGYGKEELQQLTFHDVTHPDDLQVDVSYSEQLLSGAVRSYQLEKRYIRKNGSIVPVLLTGTLVRDDTGKPLHFIAQIQDISERKQAEEKLSELNQRLALATRAGGIAVWEWDLVTNALMWDERMYEIYKLSPDDASQTYSMWRERVHPDDLQRADRDRDAAITGGTEYVSEFRIVWPDGTIRVISASAIISRAPDGTPLRMTGANIDITETRQKEEAIRAALREKETLLKELYHRVKNNLQVVTSLFNLQGRTLPEGAARTALTEGAGRVAAMALVHEKLYQSGNLSSITLDSYVSDLCQQLGRTTSADKRGIVLETEIAPLQVGLEKAVPLALLLNELICNSLKHGFPDNQSGRILVRVVREEADTVRLTVSDTGPGFPPDFNPTFSQALGLKLVGALGKQLGGRLHFENRNGAWVSLVFELNDKIDAADQIRTGK